MCALGQIMSVYSEDGLIDNAVWQGNNKHLFFAHISVTENSPKLGQRAQHSLKQLLTMSNQEKAKYNCIHIILAFHQDTSHLGITHIKSMLRQRPFAHRVYVPRVPPQDLH